MSETKHTPGCCKTIHHKDGSRFGYRSPCKRPGVVERDGSWYCRQHDPVAVRERDAALQKKHNEKWELASKERRIRNTAHVMLAALERQVANIERWLETDEPADPAESKSIYDQMVAAIKVAKGA